MPIWDFEENAALNSFFVALGLGRWHFRPNPQAEGAEREGVYGLGSNLEMGKLNMRAAGPENQTPKSQMSWCPFCFCRDGPINHLTSRRAYVLRPLPRQIACWATLWSHMAGFAHIRCSLDLQQLPMFQVGKY